MTTAARTEPYPPGPRANEPPRRVVAAVAAGTPLNALNSSMIAVALVSLQGVFGVSTGTATWLISSYYLTAAVGMPLMGRLADRIGPRRVFSMGLTLVGVTGALAPLSSTFEWLVFFRVLLALGTSAAFPSGLAIFRTLDPEGRPPAAALGVISVAAAISASFGPVLGGLLLTLTGWQGIFLFNIPLVALGLALARRWLPADPKPGAGAADVRPSPIRDLWETLDPPGIALFAAIIMGLLGFLLSFASSPVWPLLPAAAVAAVGLVLHERRIAAPFLDVRMLASNPRLVAVYAQYAAVNGVFYAIFFGFPIWLEQARGFGPGLSGLLLLPVSALGALMTPVAARLIRRSGTGRCVAIGYVTMLAASLALLLFDAGTPLVVLVAVGILLGIPNGLTNLGLQAALYETAPADMIGVAGGQLQTSRYIGAISSTAVLAFAFGAGATGSSLQGVALLLSAVSAALVVASVAGPRNAGVALS